VRISSLYLACPILHALSVVISCHQLSSVIISCHRRPHDQEFELFEPWMTAVFLLGVLISLLGLVIISTSPVQHKVTPDHEEVAV